METAMVMALVLACNRDNARLTMEPTPPWDNDADAAKVEQRRWVTKG